MIYWHEEIVSPPPLLDRVSDEESKKMIPEKSKNLLLSIKDSSCHTQAVERQIQNITRAAKKVSGAVARDDLINFTLKSRKLLPSFSSIKQYAKQYSDKGLF